MISSTESEDEDVAEGHEEEGPGEEEEEKEGEEEEKEGEECNNSPYYSSGRSWSVRGLVMRGHM